MTQNKNHHLDPALERRAWPLWTEIKAGRSVNWSHAVCEHTLTQSVLIKISSLSSHLSLIFSRGSDYRKLSIFILGYKYHLRAKETWNVIPSVISNLPWIRHKFDTRWRRWLSQAKSAFILFFRGVTGIMSIPQRKTQTRALNVGQPGTQCWVAGLKRQRWRRKIWVWKEAS